MLTLSLPLDRLNAILSLLQPLDRYRAPSAIGSAIGRPLSRPISHPRTGRSPQPPCSKPLRGAQLRDSGATACQTPLKQARNENAIEAAILNRVLDRDWTLNRRGPLSRSLSGPKPRKNLEKPFSAPGPTAHLPFFFQGIALRIFEANFIRHEKSVKEWCTHPLIEGRLHVDGRYGSRVKVQKD